MVNLLTDIGEEWVVENNLDGATVTVGLYEDATDALTDTDDVGDITTEPTGTAYARQSSAVATDQFSGDFGFDTDTTITFDTSDSTQTVDAAFLTVTFTSDTVAGDAGDTEHLVGAADLSETRDLSSVDSVEISAGDLTFTLN